MHALLTLCMGNRALLCVLALQPTRFRCRRGRLALRGQAYLRVGWRLQRNGGDVCSVRGHRAQHLRLGAARTGCIVHARREARVLQRRRLHRGQLCHGGEAARPVLGDRGLVRLESLSDGRMRRRHRLCGRTGVHPTWLRLLAELHTCRLPQRRRLQKGTGRRVSRPGRWLLCHEGWRLADPSRAARLRLSERRLSDRRRLCRRYVVHREGRPRALWQQMSVSSLRA